MNEWQGDAPDTDEIDLNRTAEGLFVSLGEFQTLLVRLLVELVRERDLFWVISG